MRSVYNNGNYLAFAVLVGGMIDYRPRGVYYNEQRTLLESVDCYI